MESTFYGTFFLAPFQKPPPKASFSQSDQCLPPVNYEININFIVAHLLAQVARW